MNEHVWMRAHVDMPTFAHAQIETKKGLKLDQFRIQPSKLTRKEIEGLFEMLYPVGLSAFERVDSESAASDIRMHLFSGDELLVITDPSRSNKAVAFQVWSTLNHKEGYQEAAEPQSIAYLAGICVDKSYQAGGIGSATMKTFLEEKQPAYVALFTQNSNMKRTVDAVLRRLTYPNGTPVPPHIREVAETVVHHLGVQDFDLDTLVQPKRYAGGALDSRAELLPAQAAYSALFSTLKTGDAYLCIGEWNKTPHKRPV